MERGGVQPQQELITLKATRYFTTILSHSRMGMDLYLLFTMSISNIDGIKSNYRESNQAKQKNPQINQSTPMARIIKWAHSFVYKGG
jgi:hypothetical protein